MKYNKLQMIQIKLKDSYKHLILISYFNRIILMEMIKKNKRNKKKKNKKLLNI
jgi:hypothetical protein